MMRRGLAILAGTAWLVTLPMAADALLRSEDSWATLVFAVAAIGTAGAWWLHLRERRSRIGLAGGMAGWLFIGSLALLGVSGFFWVLVGVGLVASTLAYGVLLLVTQSRAAVPALELVTGTALFAGAGATAIFAATTGMGNTEAWWMPAHWILAIGIGIATITSGFSDGEAREPSGA